LNTSPDEKNRTIAALLTATRDTPYAARMLAAVNSTDREAAITAVATEIRAESAPETRETRETSAATLRTSGFLNGVHNSESPAQTRAAQSPWAANLPSRTEWRAAISELTPADGGVLAPTPVSAIWVDKLRAASVVLRSGITVLPITSSTFRLPQLTSSSTPGVVPELGVIPQASNTWAGLNFTPVKFADLQASSNELIDDSNIDVRNILSTTMVRNLASSIDNQLVNGTGGTTALKGLLASGSNTKTTLATAINLDALFDAYAAIEATGAIPTAILLSPDAAAVIRKSKASTAGTYLMGEPTESPFNSVLGLPAYVSANVPAKSAIIYAADRVFVGMRQAIELQLSVDAMFAQDAVMFRATTRLAGVAVSEPTSVQWVLGV
jgi:HK97 family phage major capsid protein